MPALSGSAATRAGVITSVTCAVAVLAALSPTSIHGLGRASSADPDAASVKSICSSCHKLPPPDALPRSAWPDEIARMARIRARAEVPPDQAAPPVTLDVDMQAALRYYLAHAPERLPSADRWPAAARSLPYERRALAPPGAPPEPGVSNVELLDVDGDARPELVVCDMRHGMVLLGRPYDATAGLTLIAQVPHPSHASVTDLDGDGVRDLLVADLGEFLPWDHDKGAFVWLRGRREGGFSKFAIPGLPRVADVEAADFDGDGDLDVVVAAFGYRRTGGLLLLENRTADWATPQFSPATIDPRPGSIHAVPVDLNHDGRPDIVTVIAQEHEQVLAWINTGGLKFRAEVIYEAPHPNWGSSGIDVVDVDGDGDLDVLLAHGDTFDDQVVKPYHGIQWLENTGTFPFREHALATMPGVQRARAADLDGDGDLDIVAGALPPGGDVSGLPGLVWLEQVKKGVFERRTLEMGTPTHAAFALGDVNGDGRADIFAGNMATLGPVQSWVDSWISSSRKR